jgi:uncharacterized Zn finger protein
LGFSFFRSRHRINYSDSLVTESIVTSSRISLPLMSLAARSKQSFSASTRSRGDSYFHRGAVKITSTGDDAIVAQVAGSEPEPYAVYLNWRDATAGVAAYCNCPYYEGGDFCKHLWAAIQAADAKGLTESLTKKTSRLPLIHRFDEEVD